MWRPIRRRISKLSSESQDPWKKSESMLIRISPIGAGDTFIAGMLYALNRKRKDWDLSRKLAFANRVAGMKVSQEGFAGLDRALTSFD